MKKVKYRDKEGVVVGRAYTRDRKSLALVRFYGNKTASRVPWEKLEDPYDQKEKEREHVQPYYSKY